MALNVVERPMVTMTPLDAETVAITTPGLYDRALAFEFPEGGPNEEEPFVPTASTGRTEIDHTSSRAVRVSGLIDKALDALPDWSPSGRMGKVALPAAVMSLAAPVAATAAEKPAASASNQEIGVRIIEQKTTTTIQVGGGERTTEEFAEATVLGNYRTATTAEMKKAEKNGDCETINGAEETVYTQGYNASGKKYGRDTRESRFCFWEGKWYRKICGNAAVIGRKPRGAFEGPITWINSWGKSKLKVRAYSEEHVESACALPGVSAFARGKGEAEAEASMLVRTAVRVKGKLKSLITRKSGESKGLAHTRATGEARTRCDSTTTTTTTIETQPVPAPTAEPTPPPTQLPEVKPPRHLAPSGIGKICVDHLVRAGALAQAYDFRVYRADDPAPTIEQKQGVGRFIGDVERQSGGADCLGYQAPPNPLPNPAFTVEATAKVTGHPGFLQSKSFIISEDIFGRQQVQSVATGSDV